MLPVPILRQQLLTGELRCLPARPAIPPTPYYASHVKNERGPGAAVVVEIAKSVLEPERFFTRVAEPTGESPVTS